MRIVSLCIALGLLAVYAVMFFPMTLTVARDAVPAWGGPYGGLILFWTGLLSLLWLIWRYGARGGIAGALICGLALLLEHLGVTTGFPFGHYTYTGVLQPEVFGTVPLAIGFAWMMVVPCAYAVALLFPAAGLSRLLLVATLVLVQDLQIETVAAYVNGYWQWQDGGFFYDVPTANFVAWWLTGLALGALLEWLVRPVQGLAPVGPAWAVPIMRTLPVGLFLASTLMYVIINAARGYPLAAAIGGVVLLVALISLAGTRAGMRAGRAAMLAQADDRRPGDPA